jgi:hypothetical protein
VVDVHEPAVLDDADSGAGEAGSDVDRETAEGEDTGRLHLAHDRTLGVAALVCLAEPVKLGEGLFGRRAVALARRAVSDALVRALLVVVGTEAIQQRLQLGHVASSGLV